MNKHAYLIIAHNEPKILEVLLGLLDDERNEIFLHVDKRSVEVRKQMENIHLRSASLHILHSPMEVYWGDISQVLVEYKLFEEAHAVGPFAYYHLLSGVDLPLKTQTEIHHFFDQHAGKEFVGFWMDAVHQRDLKRKVCRYHFFTKYFKGGPRWKHNVCAFLRNVSLALQKILPFSRNQRLELRKGYNWVSITNDFCTYLLDHKEEVLRSFKYTLCPDEIFLQTMLWNSPFKEKIYSLESASEGSLRAIDWKRGNPYVWQLADADELLASPYLFARKFAGNQYEAVSRIKKVLSDGQ